MAVDAVDFLGIAQGMMDQKTVSEIHLRTAGSRAYYSLFHSAKEVIDRKGIRLIKVAGAGSHESVIATLCSMGPAAKSIGESMGRIKRFRHDCDYHINIHVGPKKVAVQMSVVAELISKLNRL